MRGMTGVFLAVLLAALTVVTACGSGGGGSAPAPANTDTTSPSTPLGLRATPSSSSAISLVWNTSTDNVAVTGYKIFRNGTEVGTSAVNFYTSAGLAVSTSYLFTVTAYDAAGNVSTQSPTATASTLAAGAVDATAPSVVSNLTATAATSSQINLSWTVATDNIGVAGYEIYRGSSLISVVTGTVFSDTGLSASTTYTYTVISFDGVPNKSAPSISASATTLASSTPTYSISGTVTTSSVGLSGVTMTLSGAGSGTVNTDASGYYSFTGLSSGSYSITPTKTGYTFNPTNSAYTVSSANITASNFTGTATAAPTYSISGTVTASSVGLSGVTMTLSGASSATVTADTNGNYSFHNLTNGNYTITPSNSGYTFTPTNSAQTVNGGNVTGINFTATATLAAPTDVNAWYWDANSTGCTIIGKAVTGSTTYKLFSSTDGTTYTDTGAVPASTSGTMFVFSTTANQSTYFKVKAVANGQESSLSNASYLNVNIKGQLAGFNVTSPANNATIVALPTFTWASVAGASYYVVHVDQANGNTTYALVKLVSTTWQYGSTSGVTFYTSQSLPYNTLCQVIVMAFNSNGGYLGTSSYPNFTVTP